MSKIIGTGKRRRLKWAAGFFLLLALPQVALAQPPCYGLIRPAFSYTQYGQMVSFVDSSITNGIDVVYEWSLGDGNMEQDSLVFAHTYAGVGAYQVCLTLTDTSSGQYCQTSFCRTVRTDVAGPCSGLVYPSFVQSDLQSNTTEFYSTSSGTTGELLWELGDGTADTTASVQHTYLWPGKYYVALNHVVYDQQTQSHCSGSVERWVNIDGNGATCTDLFANFNQAPVGGSLWSFTSEATTTLSPVGFEVWTFDDGTIGFGPFVLHDFPYPDGTYQVCMLAAASDGITDTCYAYVCHTVQLAATGIDDAGMNDAPHIWPVPFHDVLSIEMPTDEAVRLTLSDARGAEVASMNAAPTSGLVRWTVGDVAPGLYVLHVQSQGRRWTRRVIRD